MLQPVSSAVLVVGLSVELGLGLNLHPWLLHGSVSKHLKTDKTHFFALMCLIYSKSCTLFVFSHVSYLFIESHTHTLNTT